MGGVRVTLVYLNLFRLSFSYGVFVIDQVKSSAAHLSKKAPQSNEMRCSDLSLIDEVIQDWRDHDLLAKKWPYTSSINHFLTIIYCGKCTFRRRNYQRVSQFKIDCTILLMRDPLTDHLALTYPRQYRHGRCRGQVDDPKSKKLMDSLENITKRTNTKKYNLYNFSFYLRCNWTP